MRHSSQGGRWLLVRSNPRYGLKQPTITMPRIVTLDEGQLPYCRVRLFGSCSRSGHTGTGQNLGDVSILSEHDTCYALREHVLIIDRPSPTVAQFTMVNRNEYECHDAL